MKNQIITVNEKTNKECVSWTNYVKLMSVNVSNTVNTTQKNVQLNTVDNCVKNSIAIYFYIQNEFNRMNRVYSKKIANLKKNHSANFDKEENIFTVEKYQKEYERLTSAKQELRSRCELLLEKCLIILPTCHKEYIQALKDTNRQATKNYNKGLQLVCNNIGIVPNSDFISNLKMLITSVSNKGDIKTNDNNFVIGATVKSFQVSLLSSIGQLLKNANLIKVDQIITKEYIEKQKNAYSIELLGILDNIVKDVEKEENKKDI